MNNTEIIFNAMGKPTLENPVQIDGECKICGSSFQEGFKEKSILSGNFTNWSFCKAIESKYICLACSFCIKNPEIRTNSFVSDKNNCYLLKKDDLENYLFNLEDYVSEEFVVGITLSFKKHNSFRCRVNENFKKFYIRQEDLEYVFDVNKLKELYSMLNETYLQFSKEELLTGNYKFISVEQFGINKFNKYESEFKKHRGSAQFELLVHMMNSAKRNEYIQEKIKREKELKKCEKITSKKKKT